MHNLGEHFNKKGTSYATDIAYPWSKKSQIGYLLKSLVH
jgi:hypothetical protein